MANFRWVGNKKIADRLIEIWENFKRIVKFWEKLPKLKRPPSNSYIAVKNAVNDQLILPGLHLFSYVARIVESFLVQYQTKNPMIPFLYADLKTIVRQLLEIVAVPKVIETCRFGKKYKEINLKKKDKFAVINQIKPWLCCYSGNK